MKYISIFALLFLGATIATATNHYILNSKRLDTSKIAITCTNGGDATGVKVGSVLIVDCGQ